SSRRSAEAHPRTGGSPPAKPSTRSRRHARSAQPAWRRHSRSCVPRSSCRWVHRSGRSTCSLSAPFCWLPDTESRPHLRTGTEMPGVLMVTPTVAQPVTARHSGAVTIWAAGASHLTRSLLGRSPCHRPPTSVGGGNVFQSSEGHPHNAARSRLSLGVPVVVQYLTFGLRRTLAT